MIQKLEKADILQFIQANLPEMKRRYHLQKIGLFGSFSKGTQSLKSDIDLIIELEPNTPNIFELKQQLRQYFTNQFHRPVDIAREKYLKPYLRREISNEAIFFQ